MKRFLVRLSKPASGGAMHVFDFVITADNQRAALDIASHTFGLAGDEITAEEVAA